MSTIAGSLSRLSKAEITLLYRKAKRALRHPGLDILLAPKAQEVGKIIVVTPARIGPAPARNKVRRRLKAIFYEQELYAKPFDCMIIVKKDGLDIPFEMLQQMLVTTVNRIMNAS